MSILEPNKNISTDNTPINDNEKNEQIEIDDSNENLEQESTILIKDVIDDFVHRVLDIQECAQEFISIASSQYEEKTKSLESEFEITFTHLKETSDANEEVYFAKKLNEIMRNFRRHINSSKETTLEKSLFISLFATFDKYIGDLVEVLYKTNNNLYKNLNKEITLSEVLQYESLDELKESVLNKEIEILRRKSYIEQFKDLEKKFSITLTKFKNWPFFIESSQRRNLFTHCDGIVSKQYIDVCNEVNWKFKEECSIGDKLDIGTDYFVAASNMIIEVGVMLGHTLWRKTLPDQLDAADNHLGDLVFNFLHMEEWEKAIDMSIFALNLPKISDDLSERIFTINYAIALKAKNKNSSAKKILDKKDWTATILDLKLAYAVLTDSYEDAKELMIKIGKEGELITELSYHDWPVFREFREKDEFYKGYFEVYGYNYLSKVGSLVEEEFEDLKEPQ